VGAASTAKDHPCFKINLIHAALTGEANTLASVVVSHTNSLARAQLEMQNVISATQLVISGECVLDREIGGATAVIPARGVGTPVDSGNWAPKRMFFGLQGAPATFQALMMKVLSGLQEYSLVYVDNRCIFLPDWQTHLKHLQTVFDRFREHNLRLHPKKCFFAVPQILYLGHVTSESGIAASDKKVQLIKNYPTPKTQNQLRSALGLINFYRKFISGYSKKTECLRNLLKMMFRLFGLKNMTELFSFLKKRFVQPLFWLMQI